MKSIKRQFYWQFFIRLWNHTWTVNRDTINIPSIISFSTGYNSPPLIENEEKVINLKLVYSKEEACIANKFGAELYKTDFKNTRRSIFGTTITLNKLEYTN